MVLLIQNSKLITHNYTIKAGELPSRLSKPLRSKYGTATQRQISA